jgi:SAM-dependent methyltransferase
MARSRVTRGTGLLEGFLARQRAHIVNALIPQTHRSGCILDLGCGSYPLFLAQTRFARKIGIDRVVGSAFAEDTANRDISFIPHDLATNLTLPVSSNSCTVVTMLAVVEHLEPELVVPLFRDIHRVMEPAGVLILTTPAAWTDFVLRVMARVRLVSPVEINEHKVAYDHALLRSKLEKVFPEDGVQTGTFELGMNIWATACKPAESN